MSTTDILDIIKKVKAESTAGAFQPAEEKSLVYNQDQSGAFLDPESLTPADNDVISLFKKVKQGSVETPPALEVSKTPAETEAAAKQNLAARNEFMRGLYRGIDTTQAAFYGGLGMYSAAMGDTEAADRRFQQYQEQMRQASENPATVDQFFSTDPQKGAFGSVGNFGTWVAGTGGSLIPSVVEAGAAGITGAAIGGALFPAPDPGDVVTVPAGFIGGVFGRAAIKKAMAEAAQKYVEKGVAKEVADRMGRQAVNNVLAKRVGGLAAAQRITALQEGGGMYAEGREAGYDNPWSAILFGEASGLTEIGFGNMPFVVKNFIGKSPVREAIKNADPRTAAGYIWDAVKNTGEEGIQEGFQEFLGSVNESINDPEKKLLTKENFMQWAEASAAGALAGAGFGAAGAASSALQDRAERLKKLKEKGFISEEDATEAGIKGNSRRERMANVESEINRIEQEIQVQDTPDPEIASMIDGMISEGESDDEFVRQQAGSPSPQAPQVEAPVTPTPLYEVAGDENMVARVWPNPQGFLVNLTDIDSGEVFPTATIFPTFEQAKQHADTVRLPQQPQVVPPTAGYPFVEGEQQQGAPQQTPASFASRMARGEQMTSPEDQQYRINNAAEIEAELQKLMPPTGTPAPQPPAAQNPFEPGVSQPQGEIPDASTIRSPQEEVRQEQGGADLRGSGQEQVRTQPESQEPPAQAEVQIGDNTYRKIREILRPANREELQVAIPYLQALYPEYANDANDPWGIGRAVQRGDELPRVPTADLSRRIRDAISAGALNEAGDVVSREVPSQTEPQAERQPWESTRSEASSQGWGDNWSAVVRRAIDQGKPVPQPILDELAAFDAAKPSPKTREELPKAKVGDTVVRYTHKDGTGLLNNNGLDRSKLTDDEDAELIELMDFGLTQPPQGTSGTFYFTQAGEAKNARMLELLSKASKSGVVRTESKLKTEPTWQSDDGQIAVPDTADDENAAMDEMVRAEFESQMRARQSAPSEKKGKKRKKPRSLKKPTATEQARDSVRKRKADLYQQFKDEFKNKTPSGLDAKLAKIAVEIAIAEIEDGVLTFAAFVENVSTNFAADAIDEIKPYFESAWRVAHSLGLTKDPGGKFDDVLKGKAEGGKEVAPSEMHYPDGSAYRKWMSRRHRIGDHHTSFLTGHSSDPVREAAKSNPDLGLVITPSTKQYVKHGGDYSHIMVDNGAFSEFTGSAPFSEDKFFALLDSIVEAGLRDKVQFVVVPDKVGDWKGTTERWKQFYERVKEYGMPLAYVAQDGIDENTDQIPWGDFDVLFIGGSTPWKLGFDPKGEYKDFSRPTEDELRKAGTLRTQIEMIKEAKRRGKKIHMGRVNSWKRMEVANYGYQVDSADGNFIGAAPNTNLPKVLSWLESTGGEMFSETEGKPAKPAPAEVVFGEITDRRKPDLQIAAVAANNQYGIWAKIGVRWRFIGNAGANREQAIEKAKERADTIARGETTGVAFIGSELLAIKPKLIQVLENTLDPEQLVSAEKVAIGDQPVGFGKHANKKVKDLIEQEPGYVSWLIENATTPRAKQIVSYLLERPEFAAKIEQENQNVSDLVDEKSTKLLAKFGLRANASNGRIYIRGETYEWKDQIRNAGGRWNKDDEAWSFTAEGFQKLQEELRGLPIPDDATGGRLPAYIKDTELRRLREDVDGRPDSRKSPEVVAGLVGQDTKDLISQGLKIGMPQRVVNEQIEDVGSIVDAYKENKGLFLLASEPGSGKTFVLGGAIRELKKAGAKKFTYVTLRTELIGQIKNDLKAYGIDDVEFITYPAMRSGGAKPSDVLIFDEAHSVKNIDESQQAKEATKWIEKSGFTIFASATPMENPVQGEYLEPTGVFEELGGFKQFALLFGANVRKIDDQDIITWERNPLSETDAKRAQEYLTKRGVMVSRRIMLPENQVDSRFVKINVPDSDADRYEALAKAADENGRQLFGFGRPYIVNLQKRLLEAAKVDQAMDEAQAALDRGRFPIIFVETKAERKIDIPSLIERLDEYNRAVAAAEMMGDTKPRRKDFGLPPSGVVETLATYMDMTGESTIEIPSAEDVIQKRFGSDKVAVFTGSVTPSKAQKNLDAWRSGEKPLLVATMAKGGTGLSLHDKVGDHQTTQINVNLPWTATQVVQVTQRSARYGLKGKAEILWLFADNIPFDRMLSARVGGRMADMGASVHGQEIKGASSLLDWNFEGQSFAGEYDQQAEMESPWINASVEDENRWAGTTVSVSPKGKEEGYQGKVVRVLNKGETIEIQRDGFDSSTRVPAERVSIISLVDDKAGTSAEQADKAAKILSDMESNQEKLRQDKKRREGEKLANWVKAFEGSPREVTAAKDLFRKDAEKARENGVSDERLFEIIDNGVAVGVFTPQEASDLKSRVNRELAGVEGVSPYSERSPESRQRYKDIDEAWSDMRSYYQLDPESTIEDGLRSMVNGFVSGDSKSPRIAGNPDGKAYEYTGGDKRLNAIRKRAQTIANKTGAVQAIVVVGNKAKTSIPAHAVIVSSPGFVGSEYNPQDSKHFAWVNSLTKLYPEMIVDVIVPSEEKIGKKSVGASELKPRDRFVDSNGQTWEVFSSRGGVVIAHPVVDGKPQVNRDSQVLFAVTGAAKSRHPEYKTDIVSVTKWKGEEEVPVSKETQEDEEEAKVDSGSEKGDERAEEDKGSAGRVIGGKTKVGKRKAHYEVVELRMLIGSHHPFGLTVNEDFPKNWQEKQRRYEKLNASQKQQVWVPVGGFNPDDVIDPTRGHERGPTMVIEKDGKLYVVGGTRRYMMIANLPRAFPEKAIEYQNALVAEAETFGLDPEAINSMESPILIRVIEEYEDVPTLIDALNFDPQFAKDVATEAASLGRGIGKNTIAVLRDISDDETLSNFLNRKGVAVAEAMAQDNRELIQKMPGWVQGNSLTKDAKLAIQKAVMGAVIPDATLISQASPRILQSINGSLPEILSLNQKGGEWSLSERLKEAITYDAEFRSTGKASSDRNIDYWMNDPQMTFLEGFKKNPNSDGYRLWRYLLNYGGARKFRIALQKTMIKEARLDVEMGGLFAGLADPDVEPSMSGNEAFELLLRSGDIDGQAQQNLDDNLRNLPPPLFQTAPDVNENMWSEALNLSVAAQDAGITNLRDFVAYSVKTIGRDRTLQVSRFLRLAAEVAGMDGVQQAAAVSGITRDQVVTMAKRAFGKRLSDEQIEAGITLQDITAFGRNEIGFAPYGTPVPGQAMAQEDFDQPSGYKFNESKYRPAVVSYARDKWGEKIAPNGKPTWQNFVRWFGDSKVVDKDGKPLVVYHGGRRTIDNDIVRTPFFYMTANRNEAEYWAGENGRVHEVYLKFTKPYRDSQHDDRFMDMEERAQDYDWDDPEFAEELRETTREAVSRMNELKGQGYNSIVMQGELDESYDNYIAFYPTQIKSATGNFGTFDPNNPSILMQNQQQGGSVKGWTKFISAHRALIGATNKADFSTFIHEFFHPMRLFLLDKSVPAEKRADITDEEIETLEKYSGVKNGVWTVEAEEKAAKMWEQYWYEGISPNSVLDSLFQKISRWMRNVYSGIQEIAGTPLPKEIRDLFDKLVQRGLPADQRGGKGGEPVSRGEPVLRPVDPVTSIKNEVANRIALLRGSPGLVEPEAQTMDEWLEEASSRLRQDPTLGDRLVKELEDNLRAPDQIETAVLQMHYRGLNNAHEAAQDRLFAAKDRKDSVAAAKALREVDLLVDALEEIEKVDKKIGTLQARAFGARKIMLYADFSRAALERRGRAANGGERLNEDQLRQIAELAAELAKVQGDLAKAEQVIADLQRQDGVRQVVDDDIKKAPKTKTKSEPRQKAATAVQSFVKKFSSIFKPKGDSDTLMQTEDERMAEEAESVVMAYVEAGVFSYGELLANLRKEIGGELPVQAQAAFATAWEKIKAQGEIPIPMVNPGDVEGLTRIAREIEMAVIESGIVTEDQEDRVEVVLDAVWRSLQEIDPEITERQTMDALSGYGQFTPISDDEMKRLQRDINGQLLQMAKIKDLESDIRPKATGAQRREMSDEERALVRQVNELKRNSKLYTEDRDGLLKTAIGAAMRATTNRIRDLRKAMAEGKPITKTQVDLASKDKDLAEQKRILAEVTKDYREMFPRQGATPEQRLAAALRATDREIERVSEQLRTGDFSPRGRAEPVTSAELKAKQAELESLRAQRDAIKAQQNPKMSPKERAEVAYIANLKNRIADYEDRMAHGYFGAKPKKAPLESDEITKHKRRLEEKKEEFFRLAAEWRLSQLSPKERVFDWARETSFLARAIMTSMDLSAVFRQGGPGTFAHPMLAKEAAKEMRRAIFSQEEEFNIAEQMSKHRLYSFAVQAKLEVTASAGRIQNQEEAYMGRWARDGIGKKGTKINKISKAVLTPVAMSARAYTTYLNGLRFRLFVYFVDTLGANGQVTLDEAKAIANFINVSTGRGDFGSYNKVAANLSTVLFAPRYLASRFAYLGLPFYMLQDAKVSGRVKRLIAMEYARHALGVAGFMATAVALGGLLYDDDDEESPTVELDPRSTDFMKLKIGETRIDPLSGFGQIVTFLSQVGLGQKKTMEGEIIDIRGEKKKYGQDSTFDLTANFVRKKLAPIPAAGINIIAGEDVVGNKATVATATTGLFIPLAAREVVETLMARGVPEGTAIAMLNILGMSGGTYGPKTKYKNANAEERKKLIEKDLEAMEWDSKDPGYKDFLTRDELERFKQRREQRKQSLVYSASANPKRKDFQDDTTYAKAVAERDKALKTMIDGKIGPEEARLLLLAYWRRNNKTLYERKGQALVMKDALVERLRQITQKLNQK